VDLRRESHWGGWPLQQSESRLLRSSVSLLTIAVNTGGDDVLPVLTSTPRNRDDMVVGELGGVRLLSTVLASVVISNEKVVARKLHLGVFAPDLHVVQ